jgi:hypothetical protein
MIRELPEIMSETMQSIMPMIQGQVKGIRVRVEQEFAHALNGREQKTN